MTIHPSIVTHAKFMIFKQDLKAEGHTDALEILIRLWGHCQLKQLGENWGKVSPDYVEAIAGWNGTRGKLFEILTKDFCGKPGWVTAKGGKIVITSWNEHNAYIINCWNNGGKGGRPKKTDCKPGENQRVNQTRTKGKPEGQPLLDTGIGSVENGVGRVGAVLPPTLNFSIAPTLGDVTGYCQAMKWDYSPEEIRDAWLSFEGTKHAPTNQWYFGKKLQTDWRHCFELRLSNNRKNAPPILKTPHSQPVDGDDPDWWTTDLDKLRNLALGLGQSENPDKKKRAARISEIINQREKRK